MIEGKSSKVPVQVARALVMPRINLIPLHVVNTSLTPVTIYKGSIVSHTERVDECCI